MKDSQIILSDGRELAYTDIGDAGWSTILFFHGAPITRLHLAYLEDQFLGQRLRVVSADRPGYGRSTPQPGRSMADWATDVAALAQALGIDRFMVAGHSSGGAYAVTVAALLPERVAAAFVLGGVTDMGWEGAWAGYNQLESQIMRLPDEDAAIAWCVEQFGEDGHGFEAHSDFEFPEVDVALFADEHAGPALSLAIAEAFRQGVAAYARDMVVQGRPWPFDARTITAPVQVIHGELDTALPIAHSRHTAELIPGTLLRMLPGHGHMTTLSELPLLASDLIGVGK